MIFCYLMDSYKNYAHMQLILYKYVINKNTYIICI